MVKIRKDMFSLEGNLIESLLDQENIRLSDTTIPSLDIPEHFNTITFSIDSADNSRKKLKEILYPIKELIDSEEEFPTNLYTGVYEAVLNAYQHGNKYENKNIRLSYKKTKSKDKSLSLEIIVEDQGKTLPKGFLRYILLQREQKNNQEHFLNWYDFSKKEPIGSNNGTGTSFMHASFDNIDYFRSREFGGLLVYLSKSVK